MDIINFDDPATKLLIESDSITDCYPHSHLPKQLVHPSTEKGKSCQFEQIDTTIYEEEARMVAFRTTYERVQPWIKALNIFYFEFYGKHSDKEISWVDSPPTLSQSQSLKSTGLIQCQGNNHEKFVKNDFPQLLKLVEKITQSTINTNTDHQGSHGEHLETSVKQSYTKDQHVNTDENGNYADNIKRLQFGLTETISKLESSNSFNTEKILKAITNCEKAIENIPQSIKQLKLTAVETIQPADVTALKKKVQLLEDEIQSLKSQLKTEKGYNVLQEQFNSAIKHEQGMLEDTRNQIKLMVSSNNNEIDFKSKRLEEKNEEITQLTYFLNIFKKKLDEAQDEILQLKSNLYKQPNLYSVVSYCNSFL
ncbi:unnamed protein product [Mytilus coruscus]|uniref:Uncharacterized protein n=1 Tax=Mytilus coruscus TaxID=42192 RepID=A0A6J8B4N6_MYTCO|nr:unnamed protein product [Mytilus coruscus]